MSKTKVLVCDDSLLIRTQLKHLLLSLDCDVVEAANGEECISVFLEERPHLVFLDIIMPVCNGLDALQELIPLNSQQAKIVMLSAMGTSTNLSEALRLGAHDFIQKPYSREQICKAIDSLRK